MENKACSKPPTRIGITYNHLQTYSSMGRIIPMYGKWCSKPPARIIICSYIYHEPSNSATNINQLLAIDYFFYLQINGGANILWIIMDLSWIIPYFMENKVHVPNQQPAIHPVPPGSHTPPPRRSASTGSSSNVAQSHGRWRDARNPGSGTWKSGKSGGKWGKTWENYGKLGILKKILWLVLWFCWIFCC